MNSMCILEKLMLSSAAFAISLCYRYYIMIFHVDFHGKARIECVLGLCLTLSAKR